MVFGNNLDLFMQLLKIVLESGLAPEKICPTISDLENMFVYWLRLLILRGYNVLYRVGQK